MTPPVEPTPTPDQPNYAEECQVERTCHNPRLPSQPWCADHSPTPDQPEGEPVTDEPMVERLADPYLARIDDRINWRLTHVNLPIADVKYLFSTIAALQEEVNEANERAHHNHVSRTALLSQLREQRELTDRIRRGMDVALEQVRKERDTWRQRAEEAEEVVGTLQLHNERLREALGILIDIINSAMQASESRAHKANDIYEEAVFARIPPFADTANTQETARSSQFVVSDKSTDNLHTSAPPVADERTTE